MVEVGVENQNINLLKVDHRCRASVFGASVTTLNSYELLYVFVNKLIKVSSIYTDNLAVQMSIDAYKQMLKTVKAYQPPQEDDRKSAKSGHGRQQLVQFGGKDIFPTRGGQPQVSQMRTVPAAPSQQMMNQSLG